ANVAVSILNNLKISAGYAVGTRMPSLQELYWQSERAAGNAGLVNEEISEMHIQLSGNIFSNTSAGIRTQLKQVGHGIMLVDSTFTNVNAFGSLSSTAWFNYNGSLFEFCGSATYHQFGNFLKEKEA